MKKKSTLLIVCTQFICLSSFCQLRIVNSGNVGIGTNSPVGKLDVLGNFNVLSGNVGIGTTTPMGKLEVQGNAFITGGGHVFRFLPSNPGTEIGSSTMDIAFWYTGVQWNNLYAKHYYTISDSSLKQDIAPIDSSIAVLSQLNGKKYHFKPVMDSLTDQLIYDTTNYNFGFLAQEVEQILPGLVSESKGNKAINYEGIIPFLVEAIKSQQQTLDSINTRVSTLEAVVDQCCSSQRITGQNNPDNSKQTVELSSVNSIILNQNDPNPFAQSTTITWFLPVDAKNAKLYFYDNTGRILKSVMINETGKGELLVYCSDLKSGIYTYSLVVHDKVIDSKRMVCTK